MSNTNCRFSHRKISFRHRRAVKTRVSRKFPFLYVRLLLEKTSLFPEPAHKGIFGLPRRYPFHRWPICTTAVTSDSKGIDWYEKQKKNIHTLTRTRRRWHGVHIEYVLNHPWTFLLGILPESLRLRGRRAFSNDRTFYELRHIYLSAWASTQFNSVLIYNEKPGPGRNWAMNKRKGPLRALAPTVGRKYAGGTTIPRRELYVRKIAVCWRQVADTDSYIMSDFILFHFDLNKFLTWNITKNFLCEKIGCAWIPQI